MMKDTFFMKSFRVRCFLLEVLKEKVFQVLQEIPTPDFPLVSIWEMGLVSQVVCNDGFVTITVHPSSPRLIPDLCEQIVARVLQLKEIKEVKVELTYLPKWSPKRIHIDGKKKLRSWGISVDTRDGLPVCPFCEQVAEPQQVTDLQTNRELSFCCRCKKGFEWLKMV